MVLAIFKNFQQSKVLSLPNIQASLNLWSLSKTSFFELMTEISLLYSKFGFKLWLYPCANVTDFSPIELILFPHNFLGHRQP